MWLIRYYNTPWLMFLDTRLKRKIGVSKKLNAVVSHHEREVEELRADRELAVEYLKAAMKSLDNPDDRAAGLLALRTVAEATVDWVRLLLKMALAANHCTARYLRRVTQH